MVDKIFGTYMNPKMQNPATLKHGASNVKRAMSIGPIMTWDGNSA